MITHCVCKVESNGPNSFARTVFAKEKYVAIVLGNLSMAMWQFQHGKKLPGHCGRLMRLGIPRMKNKGDISKTKGSDSGRGHGYGCRHGRGMLGVKQ